jgi:hypothetical protein
LKGILHAIYVSQDGDKVSVFKRPLNLSRGSTCVSPKKSIYVTVGAASTQGNICFPVRIDYVFGKNPSCKVGFSKWR